MGKACKEAQANTGRQKSKSQEGLDVDQGEALGGEDPTAANGALSRRPMLNSVSSNGILSLSAWREGRGAPQPVSERPRSEGMCRRGVAVSESA